MIARDSAPVRPGHRALVRIAVAGTIGALALGSAACVPSAPGPGPVAASPAPGTLPPGPPPPKTGLPIPSLTVDWRPPSAAAGDLEQLATALSTHPRIGLLVDPDLQAGAAKLDAMRLAALIARLAPDTAVHPLSAGPDGPHLADVVREDPPLLPSSSPEGRTRWALPDSLDLDATRLRAWSDLGDPAVLVVGSVGVDTPTWRALSAASVGSCAPLLDSLLDGQSQSLAMLEPFLDHADAVLAQAYQTELGAVVAQVEAELADFEAERERRDFDAPGWERYQCGRQYREYLRPFSACAAGGDAASCSMTPRLFLRGSARIGTVEPSLYIPTDCARLLERDYAEVLRTPARAAAEFAADHLEVRWMLLAERLATLTEVHGALEQLCTPARRRFASADLEALRARVDELGALMTRVEEPAHDARFLANDGAFHVPGLGRVQQLAHYDGGSGSASRSLIATAKELAGFARTRGKCIARPSEPPLMAMLIDTATARPEFLGFYYAEELWCDDLGPL